MESPWLAVILLTGLGNSPHDNCRTISYLHLAAFRYSGTAYVLGSVSPFATDLFGFRNVLAAVSYDIVLASCGVNGVNMGLCRPAFVAPVEQLSRVGPHLVDLVVIFRKSGMAFLSTGSTT